MIIRVILVTIALAGLIGGLVAVKMSQFMAMAAAGAAMVMPPSTVTSFAAVEEHWEQTLAAVASLEAVQGVMVAAESSGRIERIEFQAGDWVAAGALLLKMDTASEQAELEAVEATLNLARLNLARAQQLLAKRTISQSEFDAADAEFKDLSARAEAIRVTIDKKNVKAPFSGRLGIRLIDLGQYLTQGEAIVSLQALDKLYVNFRLPQQALPNIKTGYEVRIVSDAFPHETFTGIISVISPQIDEATRNVEIQATFDNPDEKLLPGMFVGVEVVLPKANTVKVVPVTGILYAPFGDSLFVIEEGEVDEDGEQSLQVRQQFVRLGEQRGDFVAVIDGIHTGDVIVSTGAFKLRNGMRVVIDNTLAPEFELAPTPTDI